MLIPLFLGHNISKFAKEIYCFQIQRNFAIFLAFLKKFVSLHFLLELSRATQGFNSFLF
jgi:hypothetical protein